MATTANVPLRGTVSQWGDNYGNRGDRFLAAIAYLDGERPSLVMCRGYYTRTRWRVELAGVSAQRVFRYRFFGRPWSAYKGMATITQCCGVDGYGKDESSTALYY
jgi:rhamnogalacturonan endolyase